MLPSGCRYQPGAPTIGVAASPSLGQPHDQPHEDEDDNDTHDAADCADEVHARTLTAGNRPGARDFRPWGGVVPPT